jgi:hypothetical protein
MLHFRPAVIDCLKSLWVALPLKAPATDDGFDAERQRDILDAYCYALRSYSDEAVRNTVDALREGRIKDASKRFCPTSPELATYVRDEQSRLDAINRPAAIEHKPAARNGWISPGEIKERKRQDYLAAGRDLLAENVSQETFIHMARSKQIPTGAIWNWLLQEIWSPQRQAAK